MLSVFGHFWCKTVIQKLENIERLLPSSIEYIIADILGYKLVIIKYDYLITVLRNPTSRSSIQRNIAQNIKPIRKIICISIRQLFLL